MRAVDRLSSHALVCGRPHTNTSTLRISHGVHARSTSADEGRTATVASGTSVSRRQTLAGFHTLRNAASAAIDVTAATTSTSHGPWKFETRNCGTAKATPATRLAGHKTST